MHACIHTFIVILMHLCAQYMELIVRYYKYYITNAQYIPNALTSFLGCTFLFMNDIVLGWCCV